MAKTLIGQLILRLRAEGLGEAQKAVSALKNVENAARRMSGVKSWGVGFQRQLDKLKLSADDIRNVERSWLNLHDSMKSRNLSGVLKSSEMSHWKTGMVSALAQTRVEFDKHAVNMERRARTHATRMSNLIRPAFVMMGAYTAPYFAGMMGAQALSAGSSRRRELFRQKMGSIPQSEQDQIFDKSEQLSQQYPSMPITDIMEMARTARNTMGDTKRGLEILEGMVKGFVTLQSAGGVETATSVMDNLVRGIDNLGQNKEGAVGVKNTLDIIDGLIKASQIEGNQFDPGKLFEFARRSKVAGPALSTDFLMAVAPAIIQDMSASSAGTAMAMAFKSFIIGDRSQAGKRYMETQADMGLRDGLVTAKGKIVNTGTFTGAEEMARNPYAWTQKYLVPALKAKGIDINDETAVAMAVGKLSANTNATGLLTRMVTQSEQIDRLVRLYENALGTENADDVRFQDPFVGWESFKKSLENLSAALIPIDSINAGLNSLADGINKLASLGEDNPFLTALGIGGAGYGAYKGGKFALGKMTDLFGLKASAVALDGSAAALTRAAVALGGAGVADGAGGAKSPKGAFKNALKFGVPVAVGAGAVAGGAYIASQLSADNMAENQRLATPRGAETESMRALTLARSNGELEALMEASGHRMKDSLSITARPEVDSSSIDAAIGKAQTLKNTLDAAGTAASNANRALGVEMRRNFSDDVMP